VAGDLPEDADDAPGWKVGCGILVFGWEWHSQFLGLGDERGRDAFAQGAQRLAYHVGVHRPLGYRTGRDGRPGVWVAGRVEGEDVLEGAGRGVPLRECLTESPALAQRGDQGGVPVFISPRTHEDHAPSPASASRSSATTGSLERGEVGLPDAPRDPARRANLEPASPACAPSDLQAHDSGLILPGCARNLDAEDCSARERAFEVGGHYALDLPGEFRECGGA
jgi:hypothetical protein